MIYLAVLLMVGIMGGISAWNPRVALLIVVFFAPWQGLDIDIGLRVTAVQLALAPLCLIMLVRATQPGWSPPRLAAGSLLLAMALHAMLWSLLQLGFIPDLKIGNGALRGPSARAAIQVLLYLFNLSPAVLGCLLWRRTADVAQALRIYLVSLLVLAVIGWLQLLVWYATGTNPLPVGILNAALGGADIFIREGQFALDSLNIYRMNSFAGEPRNLATALVLGLMLLQVLVLAQRRPGRRVYALWGFFFASTLATFSTSGTLVWLLGTAALLPIFWLTRTPIRRSTTTIVGGLALLVAPLAIGVVVAEASGIPVIDIVASRTFERIESNGAVEDFDLAITRYLDANPMAVVTGTGLGNVHLYAAPYLDPEHALYAEGNVFQGKTGVIRTVSELGLIGFALFCLWYLALVWQVRMRFFADPVLAAAAPLAMITLVVFMATAQIFPEVWLMAGAMAALCVAGERRGAMLPRRAVPA